MAEIKRYFIMICPQTKINVSDNEIWMFSPKITDEYLLQCGRKRRSKQIAEKKVKKIVKEDCYIKRRDYILTYFNYKRRVKELFIEAGLSVFPTNSVWFKFFVPMPKSWTNKKKNQLCFEPNLSRPDSSNYHKAVEDSCCVDDKINWDYRVSKFWYSGNGHIEITIGELPPAKGYTSFKIEDKIK